VSSKFSDWSGIWLCEASIETIEYLDAVREKPPSIKATVADSSIRTAMVAALNKIEPISDT